MDAERIDGRYVEQLIDRVGRDRVFARAHALGWSGQNPPLWVWNEICAALIREDHMTRPEGVTLQ